MHTEPLVRSTSVVIAFLFQNLQLSLAARGSGFKDQVHVINQFRSHHVTSIFSLHPNLGA